MVGINELFRDGLGALGARNSAGIEQRFPTRRAASWAIHCLTAVAVALIGIAALNIDGMFVLGLIALGFVTLLQDLRRPIFVSELNEIANKPLRATILSIDNQATSFSAALLMPVMGFVADRWGLWMTCPICASILIAGFAIRTGGWEAKGGRIAES